MPKAIYNGTVLAESDQTEVVEGNHYFPPESVNMDYFSESSRHTVCPWKGTASYYDIQVGNQQESNAAWYYPEPKDAAQNIANHVAFYTNIVEVVP